MKYYTVKQYKNITTYKSIALFLQNSHSMLFPFLLSHPVTLKRRQATHNTSTNPSRIYSFFRNNHRHRLNFSIWWCQLTNFIGDLRHGISKEHIPASQQQVSIELLLNINITLVDSICN